MSITTVFTSKYLVKDAEDFKDSLIQNMGSDENMKEIQEVLDQVASEASKSKLEGSTVTINSILETDSSVAEPIQLDVKCDTSTLTVSDSFKMNLKVTVTNSLDLGTDTATTVSYVKSYPVKEPSLNTIIQVTTALKLFTEGKSFENKLTSAEIKSDCSNP